MGIFSFLNTKQKPDISKKESPTIKFTKSIHGKIPNTSGRKTEPDFEYDYQNFADDLAFVKPSFQKEMIPVIRKLFRINQNLSLVVTDMIQLTNTGFKIKFDPGVKAEDATEMRKHLDRAFRRWGNYTPGIHGLINRQVAQIYITGSLCNEWVIASDLSGIQSVPLVAPEYITFKYNKRSHQYEPYQELSKMTNNAIFLDKNNKYFKKLNPLTFRYYGLFADDDTPYGIPPYLAALEDLAAQRKMTKNMNFIVDQMGLLGFLEVLVAKPDMEDNEKDSAYAARLDRLLVETREAVKNGMGDGISVGYEGDHSYEFHSTTKNMNALPDIYDLNQRLVAHGLKTSPTMLGVSSSSETHINIVFTKMLSQLQNTQRILKENLEFGCRLELLLAGFKFDYLKIEFNRSTITDMYKESQTEEIKIRNAHNKYKMGIIGQNQVADELGYDKPDQDEPRESDIDESAEIKRAREQDKDRSERKQRKDQKPQPPRKDQKSEN